MVDTSIDHNCANDIWELMNNLNDQFYEKWRERSNSDKRKRTEKEKRRR